MIRSFRLAAGALAALAMATSASAATQLYEFKTFFDTSSLNPFDKTTLSAPVAYLSISDLTGASAGKGVKVSLSFNDTAFPGKTSLGPTISDLFLLGPGGGTLTRDSGAALGPHAGGKLLPFLQEGMLYNYDIQFAAGAFTEGTRSTEFIKGDKLTAASFTSASPLLRLGNVGGKYVGLLGLHSTVDFIGSPTAVPEPGSMLMMGLGLLGMGWVSWRRQRRI